MSIIKFFQNNSIKYKTSGHSRCSQGWVQIERCPFCSGSDYHLGINLEKGFSNCWKCGGKNTIQVIQKLLGISWRDSAKTYKTLFKNQKGHIFKVEKKLIKKPETKWPYGTYELEKEHKKYLEKRNFNPEYIKQIYDIKGTKHRGEYSWRIIAPIYKHGKMISFQGRDISEKSKLRYKACKKDNESEPHQNNLYGIDLVPRKNVIVVEGITDCWRLGPGSLGVFGISFTTSQILLLTKYSNVFILFDHSGQAQKMANRMGTRLSSLGVYTEILDIDIDDPGSMSDKEAKYLIKYLKI